MKLLSLFVIGVIFGLGISLSGMGNPAKVVNFFDFAGTWDPSLIFVMGGALVVTFIGYKFVLGWKNPIFSPHFFVPSNTNIDFRLVGGSAVFGIGWGIAGFCPGGALPVLGTGNTDVFLFVLSLLAGVWAVRLYTRFTS